MVHASSGSHIHISRLQVQAQCEERETKRRKVQEVTKEEQEDKEERETKRQKVQAAIVKAQKLAWITAERERETKRQERETKRQEQEESGVGVSVEQLKLNRDKPENAAKLEKHPDVYYQLI